MAFVAHRAAGLEPNFSKCVHVPLAGDSATRVAAELLEHRVAAAGFQVSRNAKYLGVWVGPGGLRKSWEAPSGKLMERAWDIKSLNLGFFKSVCLYNKRAHPVLSHTSQFYPPSSLCLSREREALQVIMYIPREAILSESLFCLDALRFELSARSIENAGAAALYRAALTSPGFVNAMNLVDSVDAGIDRLLDFRDKGWMQESITFSMISNFRRLSSIPSIPCFGTTMLQRKTERILIRKTARSPRPMILRRMQYFEPLITPSAVDRYLLYLNRLHNMCAPCIVSACLKAGCNAWCTSRRFPGPTRACPWCGSEAGDDILHLICCPSIRPVLALFPLLPAGFPAASASSRLLLLAPERHGLSADGLLSLALLLDVLFNGYHTLKAKRANGGESILRYARARIRHASARDARIQAALRG